MSDSIDAVARFVLGQTTYFARLRHPAPGAHLAWAITDGRREWRLDAASRNELLQWKPVCFVENIIDFCFEWKRIKCERERGKEREVMRRASRLFRVWQTPGTTKNLHKKNENEK